MLQSVHSQTSILVLTSARVTMFPTGNSQNLLAPEGSIGVYLKGPGMNDAGLMELAGLANLRTLYIEDTAVTDAGLNELNKTLPHLSARR